MDLLLAVHLAATAAMAGVIWFVQLVHYRSFAEVDRKSFPTFEQTNMRRTTWVVGPPMLVEMTCALLLVLNPPPGVATWQPWLGAALLLLVWLSTATLQIPRHSRLLDGFDAGVHRSLLATNWIRTVGWTVRVGLAVGWVG